MEDKPILGAVARAVSGIELSIEPENEVAKTPVAQSELILGAAVAYSRAVSCIRLPIEPTNEVVVVEANPILEKAASNVPPPAATDIELMIAPTSKVVKTVVEEKTLFEIAVSNAPSQSVSGIELLLAQKKEVAKTAICTILFVLNNIYKNPTVCEFFDCLNNFIFLCRINNIVV